MPPFIPPELFLEVLPEALTIGSLHSLPHICAHLKPSPNSTPLVAGTANTSCAIRASSDSKNGSPRPAFTPRHTHSTTPPTESPCKRACSTISLHLSLFTSPFICVIRASISTSLSIRLATTPAATKQSVKRPEKWPPPRGSLKPLYFTPATKSACEGRGEAVSCE